MVATISTLHRVYVMYLRILTLDSMYVMYNIRIYVIEMVREDIDIIENVCEC